MEVRCCVRDSRLVLKFDGVKDFYFKGSLVDNYFMVQKEDYEGTGMTDAEIEAGLKAIEQYNSKGDLTISIVED